MIGKNNTKYKIYIAFSEMIRTDNMNKNFSWFM